MKVLVIGSEGFIGKNIITFFSNNNYEIIGIDSRISGEHSKNYKYIIS